MINSLSNLIFQMYGIIKGKLDHLKRSVEVQFAAGRDLKPGQLGNIIETLTDWFVSYLVIGPMC
ncbi:hypothetical protein RchiOBHm_Chr1g0355181 [Rosa chinensis]|uniref:Uncharacterized protein n=1 Tax=Rosa chinensis TaxID=74649 RepID=A0A2P6SHE8_ROSCH|nr:hypothetical protein RchiOBHm_Chr1g0355181 [Rosa chinensis]